mgnify:CR=1 FL=1
MSIKVIESFLKDMTYSSSYSLLECGKDDEELKKIAEKRGIVLPAIDLAVFKCKYAFVDRTNLNGCELPKEEVEKSLTTLVGKAIDFDHLRGRIVGVWIDAKLQDDWIVAYGIFFKGNLQEDYEVVQDLLRQNKLRVSFEAYGTRSFKEDGTYSLADIQFAGGALLIATNPACPGSEVMDMANTNRRYLELANTLKAPEKFIHNSSEFYLEKARMYSSDFETIMRLMGEVTCPLCQEKWTIDVDNINFQENTVKGTCFLCSAKVHISLTPKASIMTQARTIKEVKAVDSNQNNKKGEQAKMTEEKKEEVISSEKAEKLPEDIVKAEEDVIESPEEDLKKDEEEAKTEEVKEEAKTEETKVEEAKPEVKTEEVANETEEVKTLKAEIEVLKAQLQKKDEEITAKVEEAKKQTATLIERKNVLGSFAKDTSDAEILEDAKFEILRLKKEVAELKQTKLEKSSLEVGGEGEKTEEDKDKKEEVEEDRGIALGKKVQAVAFPQK